MEELRELTIRRKEIEEFKFEVIDCIAYPCDDCEVDYDYETTLRAKKVSIHLEDFNTFEEALEALKKRKPEGKTRIEGHIPCGNVLISYPDFEPICIHEYVEEHTGRLWCEDCGCMLSTFGNLASYMNIKSGHTFKPAKKKRIKK